MIDINTALQNILKAVYGKEVRQSIHDAIYEMNEKADNAVDLSQIRFGTDITSPTSPIEGYIEGNIYFNIATGIIWRIEGGSWTDKGHFKTITQISGPEKEGLKDTYTIEFNDGSTHEYEIMNGRSIVGFEKTGTSNLEDIYTVTFNDNTTDTFRVTNGKGIVSLSLLRTEGLKDIYRVNYNDGTNQELVVTNGERGNDGLSIVDIVKGSTSGLTTHYDVLLSDGTLTPTGFDVKDGKDAVSIRDITLVSTVGATKTYRIDLTDGTATPNQISITDGVSSYLHVRYSSTFDGQNFVTTPTKDTPYIGIVVTTQNVAPTDPAVYKWVRFIGQNGEGTGDMLAADYVTIYPGTKIVDKAAALWDGEKEIYGADMMQKNDYAAKGVEGTVDKATEVVDVETGKTADSKVLANLSEDEDGNLKYKGKSIGEVDAAFSKTSENPVQNKVVAESIEILTNKTKKLDSEGKISSTNVNHGDTTLADKLGTIDTDISELGEDIGQITAKLSDNEDWLKNNNLFGGFKGGFLPTSGSYPTTNSSYPSASYLIIPIPKGESVAISISDGNADATTRLRYGVNNTIVGEVYAVENDYIISTLSGASGIGEGIITAKQDNVFIGVMLLNGSTSVKYQIEYGDIPTAYKSFSMSNVEITKELEEFVKVVEINYTIGVGTIPNPDVDHYMCIGVQAYVLSDNTWYQVSQNAPTGLAIAMDYMGTGNAVYYASTTTGAEWKNTKVRAIFMRYK